MKRYTLPQVLQDIYLNDPTVHALIDLGEYTDKDYTEMLESIVIQLAEDKARLIKLAVHRAERETPSIRVTIDEVPFLVKKKGP